MIASANSQADAVKLLVEAGANPKMKNQVRRQSMPNIAFESMHRQEKVPEMLQKHQKSRSCLVSLECVSYLNPLVNTSNFITSSI